jgi:hypothetical protein
MTQRQRILELLNERGPRGLHSFELYAKGMPRGAAVIDVLRKEGYDIGSTAERFHGGAKGVRYTLRDAQPVLAAESSEAEALFTPTPANAYQFDVWDAA